MSDSENITFSTWRRVLWPIQRHELSKFLPLLLIFFFVSLDYNILRTLKDTLVVTPAASGAEVIPFIKVWVLLPTSILLTLLFTRLARRFTFEGVFNVMISLFLVYFFFFITVAYPNSEYLHCHAFADSLEDVLPKGCKGLISMIRYWSFTTFYVMSELWSNIVLSMLFWGFANHVTKVGESKRFYGLLGIGANFSGIIAGFISMALCSIDYYPSLPYGKTAWDQSLFLLISIVIISGLITLAIFKWMHVFSLADQKGELSLSQPKRLSMRENFSTLFRSRYLLSIAVIVLSYNLIINLVEVMWKHEVRALYPNPSDFGLYMNKVMTIIGVMATFTSVFLTGNIVRWFGWSFTALLTPAVLLISSIAFFAFFFMKQTFPGALFFGMTPLALSVFFGTLQNCLSRGAKYTVFDASREMAFVPLSPDTKIKGKAAIDGVCSRLGKSGGSVIHQSLFLIFGTITQSAPFVAAFLLSTLVVWIGAVKSLGRKYESLSDSTGPIDEALLDKSQKEELSEQVV